MNERWYLHTKKADFGAIAKQFHISPVLARIIRNRDVTGEQEIENYLYPDIGNLSSPWLFKDMDKAVDLLKIKIGSQNNIRIICDYDVDGICSGYILLKALKLLDAVVDIVVPHRIEDGYGINESLIKKAYDDGIDTIITCDNGIAAYDQVEYVKSLGMSVIITDHHQVPFEEENGIKTYIIPNADAVINQKQEDCNYPYKELCGAMVAFGLMRALFEAMGRSVRELDDLYAYGAIATVCDVVDLTGENRIIVKYGIERLKKLSDVGINALMDACEVERKTVSAYHLGFIIGPCLNASGRLDTAKKALELLDSTDAELAKVKAEKLKKLNDDRKAMTEEGTKEAIKIAEQSKEKVLVIYLPDVHESIAGIIAGRIREQFHKPVIILTDSESGIKGSGRSIEEYNMYEELSRVKDLFTRFGGHKMAAGVSLKENNPDLLKNRLNENCNLTEDDLYLKVWIDMQLPLEYVTMKLVEELNLLEPFGKANPKPVFAEKDLKLLELKILGKTGNVLKMKLENQSGYRMTAMLFGRSQEFMEFIKERFGQEEIAKAMEGKPNGICFMATFYPKINEYMGNVQLQIVIDRFC